MNPGVTEEGGKALNSVIDSLKQQPLTLALVLVIVGLLAFLFYSEVRHSEDRKSVFDTIIQQQKEMTQLLSHCVVPARGVKDERPAE